MWLYTFEHCGVCCGRFSSVRSIEEHCAVEYFGALEGTRRAPNATKGDPPDLVQWEKCKHNHPLLPRLWINTEDAFPKNLEVLEREC